MAQVNVTATHLPSRPEHRARRWRRRLSWTLGIAAFIVASLMTWQAVGQWRDARRYPAPGQRYTIGEQQIHLVCMGEGSPTVILEALAGGFSSYWAWVQPAVAQTTRVCAYDRPGLGWSTPGPHPADGTQVATTLHELLQTAHEPGPYVLVGHSIGALYVRHFAAAYPDDVLGILLLDGAHPEQFIRNPALAAEAKTYTRLSTTFAPLARLGVSRAYFALGGRLDFGELPTEAQTDLMLAWSSPRFFVNRRTERPTTIYPVAAAQLGTLGDLPLIVVSADTSQSDSDFWATLQDDLATLSTQREHITVPQATHTSLIFNPDHAAVTADAITRLVATVRHATVRHATN